MKLPPEIYAQVAERAERLVSPAEMDLAIGRMAQAIGERLAGSDPLVLAVMSGGAIAAGLLLPRLTFPLRLSYLHATRYRGATSGGELHWVYRPSDAIRGETLLIVDDILDEGDTLDGIVRACEADGAKAVLSAVLVAKRRPHKCQADFIGVEVADRYVFGYGLDYKGYFRNAPGIFAVSDTDL